MEDKGANIPESVWELIATTPFELLTDAEKTIVLAAMEPEEYIALQESTARLQQAGFKAQHASFTPVGRKSELLARFDERHGKVAPSATSVRLARSVRIWRAAAVFFVALSTVLLYERTHSSQPDQQLTVIADTAAKVRELVVTKVIHDTFLLMAAKEDKQVSSKALQKAIRTGQLEQDSVSQTYSLGSFRDVHIVVPSSLHDRLNRVRGTRRKDDTLADRFATVSL
jgi:hypothetical protein